MKQIRPRLRAIALLALFFASISFALVSSPLKLVYAPPTPATVTEYAIPTLNSLPTGLTVDPSGNSVWFVELNGNKLARLDPVANTIQEWAIPTPNSQTTGLAATTIGGSTAVFGVEFNTNKVFIFFSSTNTFREYTLPTPNSGPEYISIEGPGALVRAWFSEIGTSGTRNAMGELIYDTGSNTATLNEMTLPAGAGGGANGIYAVPGVVWLAGFTGIVRWNAGSNQFSTWPIPSHPSTSAAFVAPASPSVGQIWYTSSNSGGSSPDNYVGLLRGDNTFKEWQIPTLGAAARVVSVSPTTQNPWVAEEAASKVAQLDPTSGGTVSGGGSPTVTSFAPIIGALVATPPSPVGSAPVPVTPVPNPNTGVPNGQFTEWTITASTPHDVAVDNSGNTWIAESGSNKIAKLAISTPDFSLSASAPTITIPQGGSGSITITGTSVFGFTGAVTLSVTGTVPTGVTSSLSPNPISIPSGSSASSTLTLNVASSATPGSSSITVTGTGAGTHVTTFNLTIAAGPDFTIAASPNSLTVTQGTSMTSTITVGSMNGFSSAVALSYSWISAPSGVTVSLPGPVTPPSGSSATSMLTVTASLSASTGSYTLSVTGTSGTLIHPVNLAIQVTAAATTSTSVSTSTSSSSTATSTSTSAPGPSCLIATATFGSELSPEVQLLRNLRDNAILKTQAGSSFMILFNAWYYSFSPFVANYLTDHWVERTVMKGVLYPLIGIMSLSSVTFAATSAYPEIAALLAGLVASSLIGAFYIGIPLGLVRVRIHRLSSKRAEPLLTQSIGITLLAGMIALAIGEATASQGILMVASSTIVLSTLTLSSIATSSFLSKRIASPNQ